MGELPSDGGARRRWSVVACLLAPLWRRATARRAARALYATDDAGHALHLRECQGSIPVAEAMHADDNDASARILGSGADHLARLIAPLAGDSARAIAVRLIEGFGSIPALFQANRRAIAQAMPGRPDLVELLLAVRPMVRELLRAEMVTNPALPDNRSALRYLHASMAHEPAEHVRMLYLDAKNRVLHEEVVATGTVTRTDIVPREIVRRALDYGATGLIMAHNHPSGDPEPSRNDLAATRAVADAAKLFDIILHDHIVIARSGYVSLREEGYL